MRELRELPTDIQYHVRRMVGWTIADPRELRQAVLWRTYPHVIPTSADPRRNLYQYFIPRWCGRCGEYRTQPATTCPRCGNMEYRFEAR